ncbi:hypothetical protein BJ964_003917 [Actinoplanes lobatus]|uniref:Uncharacterized protein n=1 Tax=Actinoplanes lobatus TaxID=113568 RepID=A0A7W7HFS7_9ACTN|nr:hypothetical protein [Actinoplanes lobatus]
MLPTHPPSIPAPRTSLPGEPAPALPRPSSAGLRRHPAATRAAASPRLASPPTCRPRRRPLDLPARPLPGRRPQAFACRPWPPPGLPARLLPPCPARPCPALPGPARPCPALPGPARPCPALPGPARPCPALPCPASQLGCCLPARPLPGRRPQALCLSALAATRPPPGRGASARRAPSRGRCVGCGVDRRPCRARPRPVGDRVEARPAAQAAPSFRSRGSLGLRAFDPCRRALGGRANSREAAVRYEVSPEPPGSHPRGFRSRPRTSGGDHHHQVP